MGCTLILGPILWNTLPGLILRQIKGNSCLYFVIDDVFNEWVDRLVKDLEGESSIDWSFLSLVKGSYETVVNHLECVLILDLLDQAW